MHRVDDNDLAHALRLGLDVVAAMPCPLDEAGRINPQVTRFALRGGQWADVVHVKPVYYQHASGAWRPLSEVCLHHGNREIVIRPDRVSWVHPAFLVWLMRRQRLLGRELRFGGPDYAGVQPRHMAFANSLTAYPDPNPETTTVDGFCYHNPVTAVWATSHDATASTNAYDNLGAVVIGCSMFTASNIVRFERFFALFSTGALGSGASVTAATLSVYPTSKSNGDNDGDDWLNVVQSSPASNTAITTADFNQCGAVSNPTEGATRIDLGLISTGAYCDWTLDATGRGWISTTGITKLGLREGHDCLNSAIADNTTNTIDANDADAAGTSTDPKLTITYTPPPAGFVGDPLRAFQHMILR